MILSRRRYASSGFAFNNALQFDGVDDYVSFNDTSIYCAQALAWSFNIWVKKTGTASFQTVLKLKSGVNLSPFVVFISTNGSYSDISLGGRTSSIRVKVQSVTPSFLNNWKMVSVTYNGLGASTLSNYNIFLDGSVVTAISASAFSNDIDISLLGSSTSGAFLDGLEDNFAFWDSELTITQMSNQWNSGNGNFANVDVAPRTYYKMDESDPATTLVDSSGNGNDAQLNDFTVPNFVSH